MNIQNYHDFCKALLECGFSMGGGNAKGIFALIPFTWENPPEDSPVRWHTGNAQTDPWEWRMRVLEERDDIAYGKLFFRTSGYITKEWYPAFYAVRRKGECFDEAYENGTLSATAKRIYQIIAENKTAALHEIKALGGFGREDKSKFDRAITELQMRMFITLCGRSQKISRDGTPYGWNSTVFMTVEAFWEQRGFVLPEIAYDEAFEKISSQVLRLNPTARPKDLVKFIMGA